jgi:hypothetical protein
VSDAYVNNDGPGQPIADAVTKTDPQPLIATFDTASVLVFHRDHRMYEWTHARPLRIGLTGSDSLSGQHLHCDAHGVAGLGDGSGRVPVVRVTANRAENCTILTLPNWRVFWLMTFRRVSDD